MTASTELWRVRKALGWLGRTTPGQQVLIGTACRGVLNMITARDDQSDPINKVVIDYRNRELAGRIVGVRRQDLRNLRRGSPAGSLAGLEGDGHGLGGQVHQMRPDHRLP